MVDGGGDPIPAGERPNRGWGSAAWVRGEVRKVLARGRRRGGEKWMSLASG